MKVDLYIESIFEFRSNLVYGLEQINIDGLHALIHQLL